MKRAVYVAASPQGKVMVNDPELLQLYARMFLIREAEMRLSELFNDGKVPGFIHLSVGQEATCVGVCAALVREDTIASTHRGHGHCIAKGVDLAGLFHEILGHAEGLCKGQGGSLHVADFGAGMLGANGIVGGGIPIAAGSALAHKTLANGRVAVSFFGDGAMSEGVFYETLNLAALWQLPILFVCENNGWSEFSPTDLEYAGDLEKLSASFRVPHRRVDGNDVEDVLAATRDAVGPMRKGRGPAVLECMTLRVRGHFEGDPQHYRAGVLDRPATDPLEHTRARLETMQIAVAEIEAAERRVRQQIDETTARALRGSSPAYEHAIASVYL
jgi:pyruvate dehydrogenase E1 component alpha subunit